MSHYERYVLDQGSIIAGVKSSKYPNIKCYAILITASCDIANSKVSRYYYLIGLSVDDWISSKSGFDYLFKPKVMEKRKECFSYFESLSLDPSVVSSYSEMDCKKVMEYYGITKKKAKDTFLAKYKTLISIHDVSSIAELHSIEIDDKNIDKIITSELSRISQGIAHHYYYLPECSYNERGSLDKGLIIDLQEIEHMNPKCAEMLVINRGIDYDDLTSIDEKDVKNEFLRLFNFDDDEFVDIEDKILSPWREHLMQRFSNGFVRIGLDGAKDEDFKMISQRIRSAL